MEYTGHLTADDLIAAYRLHRRKRTAWGRLLGFYAIFTVVAFIFFQIVKLSPDTVYSFLAGVVATVVGLYLYGAAVSRRRMRRLHAEMLSFRAPFQTRIDGSGFATVTELDTSRRSWAELRSWKENAQYFLLYESTDFFRIIPKRLLGGPSGVEELRQLFLEHLGAAA